MSTFGNDSGALWRYQLDPTDWTERLVGYKLAATDGEVGQIDTTTMETGAQCLVANAGSWLRSKKVMLPAGLITSIDHETRTVFINATKEQIKNAPDFDDADPVNYRDKLGGYYSSV